MEKKTVWYFSEKNAWRKGELYAQRDKNYYVRDAETQSEETTTLIEDFDEESTRNFKDMVQIPQIKEATLLHNLKQRYQKNQIYTYIGPILLAVNPYDAVDIYSPTDMEQFRNLWLPETPYPHTFAIASNALLSLQKEKQDQAVIISGESGAGKTESSKHILNFLAHTTEHGTLRSLSATAVETRILLANPILESFGNAKTVRNDNSSRFGKLIEIAFQKNQITSAQIESYLLEKSRVVFQGAGERNYHIFYQLLSGASQSLKKQLSLANKKPEDFHYLSQGTTTISDIDDAADFEGLVETLKTFGFSNEDQIFIWGLLSFLLFLGNIKFKKMKDKDSAEIENQKSDIQLLSDLCGSSPMIVSQVLTCRIVQTGSFRKSTYNVPLSVRDAVFSRDTMAKHIYNTLFNWILNKINTNLRPKPETNRLHVRILDIFGFENFDDNSFEQMLINYANEKLQSQFNVLMFSLEQEAYKKEGVVWEDINIIDNTPVVEFFDKKGPSFFNMLDEEGKIPQGSDDKLLVKLQNTFKSQPYWKQNLGSKGAGKFCIKHYAGDVAYTISGFLEKNQDAANSDLDLFLGSCENPFFKTLFQNTPPTTKTSVSKQFKESLSLLIHNLSRCNLFYIRCIKPNTEKSPQKFDGAIVLHQLKCLGILETIKLRKAGYSFRQTFEKFLARYKTLLPSNGTPKAQCEAILKKFSAGDKEWTLGKTVVFLKEREVLFLENELAVSKISQEFKEEKQKLSTWISTTLSQLKSLTANDLTSPQAKKNLQGHLDKTSKMNEDYSDKLYDYDAVLRLSQDGKKKGVQGLSSEDLTQEWRTLSQAIEQKQKELRAQIQAIEKREEEEKRLKLEQELQQAKQEEERKKKEEEKRLMEQELEMKRKQQEEEEQRLREEELLRKEEETFLENERDYGIIEDYIPEDYLEQDEWEDEPAQVSVGVRDYGSLPSVEELLQITQDAPPEVSEALQRLHERHHTLLFTALSRDSLGEITHNSSPPPPLSPQAHETQPKRPSWQQKPSETNVRSSFLGENTSSRTSVMGNQRGSVLGSQRDSVAEGQKNSNNNNIGGQRDSTMSGQRGSLLSGQRDSFVGNQRGSVVNQRDSVVGNQRGSVVGNQRGSVVGNQRDSVVGNQRGSVVGNQRDSTTPNTDQRTPSIPAALSTSSLPTAHRITFNQSRATKRLTFMPTRPETALFTEEELNTSDSAPPQNLLNTPVSDTQKTGVAPTNPQSTAQLDPAPGPRIVSQVYTDLQNRKDSIAYKRYSKISIQDLNEQLDNLIVLPKKGKKDKTAKKVQFFNSLTSRNTKEDKKKTKFAFFSAKKKKSPKDMTIEGPTLTQKQSLNYEDLEGYHWVGSQN